MKTCPKCGATIDAAQSSCANCATPAEVRSPDGNSSSLRIPKGKIRAAFQPETYDAENHTIDIVWTTGAKVRRSTWYGDRYNEELVVSEQAIRLERMNTGAPFLAVHDMWELDSVLGVVEDGTTRIVGNEGRAKVRFFQHPDVEKYEQGVAQGIYRNISVGYDVHVYEKIEEADSKIPTYRATDWEPLEISLVPVGADAGAQVRSTPKPPEFREVEVRMPRQAVPPHPAAAPGGISQEVRTMKTCPKCGATLSADQETCSCSTSVRAHTPAPFNQTEHVRTAPETVPAIQEAQVRQAAAQAERTRINEIQGAVRLAGLGNEVADELINGDIPLDQARAKIFERMAARSAAAPTVAAHGISVTRAEQDTQRRAMESALILRANPRAKLTDEEREMAREYRGMDLSEMAREAIERAGGRARGLNKREIAVAAMNLDRDVAVRSGMHSTSDFPNVLASTVNRTLRQAYQLAPRTFVPWCRQSTLPDFREAARTQLSELSAFQKVKEAAEYKVLSFGDSAEKYSLSKYGGIIPITWEVIINDDTNFIERIPMMIAEEAAATESDIVYGILTGNPNMADAKALFHADHANLLAATAISDVHLTTARIAMKEQKGPKGRVLNLLPEFLIVGSAKEGEANKYTSASFVAAKASDINPNFNTSLEVISEARITGNKWFLAASPNRVDTIEYSYLEGEEGLFTEQKQGFEVDGLLIKARHVFAAKAIDWRGMTYNPGA